MTRTRLGLMGVVFAVAVGWRAEAQAQWTALTNAPPGFLDPCLLLTDGSVMCHEYNTNRWHRLSPDVNGSYANGTWNSTPILAMPNANDAAAGCMNCAYQPLFFCSSVLADGRVVVIGGEYLNLSAVWTNIGFIYDPAGDPGTGQGTWSAQLSEAFGSGRIGDSMCIVLENGTHVLSDIATGNLEALNPATLTYTALNPPGKLDPNNEENWNILPDGRLLTVDSRIASSFELYDPIANSWGNSGSTGVNMADIGTNTNSAEVGPGVLRPDGTLIYFSGNNLGQNGLYNTATNTWTNTAAMDFPLVAGQTYHYSVPDGPAALLPNGNVLVMGSPATNTPCGVPPCGVFNTPSHFWELDFATNTLVQVADSPNAASFIAYQGHFLVLPTGELLMTSYNQGGHARRPAVFERRGAAGRLAAGDHAAAAHDAAAGNHVSDRGAAVQRPVRRRDVRRRRDDVDELSAGQASATTPPATCSTREPTTTARWACRRWGAPRSPPRSSTCPRGSSWARRRWSW